jgi:Right handed beta helix region
MLVSRIARIPDVLVRKILMGTIVGGLVTFFSSSTSWEMLCWHGKNVSAVTDGAAGSQFYVSTAGNDFNSGTSASSAWRTIQHAMNNATAGSTVNIMAGTYHEQLSVNVSGTAGHVITFQPLNFSVPAGGCGGYTGVTCGGDAVVLDYAYLGTYSGGVPCMDFNNTSYVTVQGITLQNFTTLQSGPINWLTRITGTANHITLQYNHYLNSLETGGYDGLHYQHPVYMVGGGQSYITVVYNEFGNLINHDSAFVADGNSNNVTFSNNWVHDIDQIGIATFNGANHNLFSNNKLEYISQKRDGTYWYNTTSVAMYDDGGNTGVMERNFVSHAGVGFEALSEPGQPATHDVTVRNNIVQYCQRGIVLGTWYSSTNGSSVYNIHVWNNTFYANTTGVTIRPMVSSTVTWENNIFAKNGTTYINMLNWNPGNAGYNVYFGGGTGPGSNNLISAPLFVRTSAGNFSLQSTSPAINAGDPNTSANVVGSVDFAGNPRILGGRVDIGAYEAR